MICFELELNGRRLVTAGIPGFAVLSWNVTWVHRKPTRPSSLAEKELTLHLGGLDSNFEGDEGVHLNWVDAPLKVGDRVALSVLETESSDPPLSPRERPTSGQLEQDRVRSARYWLREFKRQRAELDGEIKRVEKVLAAAKKRKR